MVIHLKYLLMIMFFFTLTGCRNEKIEIEKSKDTSKKFIFFITFYLRSFTNLTAQPICLNMGCAIFKLVLESNTP